MIEYALVTLADRKGSSRPAIWKCLSAQFPEADYKQFLIRLKKIAHEKKQIIQNKQRFRLEPNYRQKLARQLEKGTTVKKVKKTKATMKKSKRK